jgi:acetolactate synthase small subunit
MHRHTISVLVENKFGVLARVAGMFSGRGFNIHSLNVGPSHDPTISRMTLVVNAKDDKVVDQIIKQLDKLIDVITVIDFREGESVERELVLLQVNVNSKTRAEAIELCTIFPRQDHRCRARGAHHRDHRRHGQGGEVHPVDGGLWHQGPDPHREDRPPVATGLTRKIIST